MSSQFIRVWNKIFEHMSYLLMLDACVKFIDATWSTLSIDCSSIQIKYAQEFDLRSSYMCTYVFLVYI